MYKCPEIYTQFEHGRPIGSSFVWNPERNCVNLPILDLHQLDTPAIKPYSTKIPIRPPRLLMSICVDCKWQNSGTGKRGSAKIQ